MKPEIGAATPSILEHLLYSFSVKEFCQVGENY